MARKPRPAAEPEADVDALPDGEVEEGPGRPVRSEHRADMDALKALANRIAKLSPGMRRSLPLEPETLEVMEQLAAAGLKPDRRRTLMRAKLLLAHADVDAVVAVIEGRGPAADAARAAEAWRDRLLAGDDAVLTTFLASYPGGDRQVLRTALREARGDSPAARRALPRLHKLVREAVDAVPAAPDDELDPDDVPTE